MYIHRSSNFVDFVFWTWLHPIQDSQQSLDAWVLNGAGSHRCDHVCVVGGTWI